MTFNVGNGLAAPARLARALRESGADVVGLVEVTQSQADALRGDVAERYQYSIHHGDGIPGKALLSRFPIRRSTPLELHPDRPDLLAEIELAGHRLRALVAHPPPPRLHRTGYHFTSATRAQFAEILKIAATGEPTIVLGDFNMLDDHEHHAQLVAAGFADAFRNAGGGPGFTYPRRHGRFPLVPFFRLDYVWHSAHLRAIRAWVGDDAGSDHLPVHAELVWTETRGATAELAKSAGRPDGVEGLGEPLLLARLKPRLHRGDEANAQ
jgi:endonuclease/exonuclease/phosphatase family metal-dependent hydrolase